MHELGGLRKVPFTYKGIRQYPGRDLRLVVLPVVLHCSAEGS